MKNRKMRSILLSTAAALAVVAGVASSGPVAAQALLQGLISTIESDIAADLSQFGIKPTTPAITNPNSLPTATPIKHLVVIFNENRSYDHYFGTYPKAMNPPGEPVFVAARNTPASNNFESNLELLSENPNLNLANNTAGPGTGATNPFRLDRSQSSTADQNHAYTPEQLAYDNGAMDLFPKDVGAGSSGGVGAFGTRGQTMGYFDGNTVTAFWNYAQNFAMSDNAWTDTFGPSTPGAMEMFSGQTNGVTFPVISPALLPKGTPTPAPISVIGPLLAADDVAVPDGQGGLTQIADIDPFGDVCSSTLISIQMTSKNIGDLLNAANIPWGSFAGGFNLLTTNPNGSTGCNRSTVSPVNGGTHGDYTPHHMWFQYWASTINPTHARPTSVATIGHTLVPGTTTVDPANHAYDIADFTAAVQAGNYPAVSFIKLTAFQDAHPGNSDPLDEQEGVVGLINMLTQLPDWNSTAVIIAYDDSDGWYDHAFIQPTTRASFTTTFGVPGAIAVDQLNGPGLCGIQGAAGTSEPNGLNGLPVAGRCGPGTRTPFLVISPWAKKNFIDHTFITQASIPQFIEDNWLKGQRLGGGSFDAQTGSIMTMFNFDQIFGTKLILDPVMGTVVSSSSIIE
jgi:phospholipase C